MEKRWASWSEMEEQYREGALALKKVRERMKADDYQGTVADREIMGGMIRDLEDTRRVLKTKVLYEFGSLSENELVLLTDRQREIAELRQRYNYREIAEILGISPKTAFDVFQKAVRNVKKIKRQGEKGLPIGLSPQQEQIYILSRQGKSPKEIAEIIGCDYRSIHTQLKRISKKVDKSAR
ncbi:sigma factor-like helix-turn-helix DNA-binding protein [Thermoanaerobacterium sp. DL9XJH110]|uniref:sigma factor-like helix-turn-helix DNA-binding protein n=1 Tax=Thermoanaerobacterium sp. DL9XJH110 TaxID=3386643 RepID=UPI003BB5FEF7